MIDFSGVVSLKKQRLPAVFFVCAVLVSAVLVSCSRKSKFPLEIPGYPDADRLEHVMQSKSGSMSFFRFSGGQVSMIGSFFREHDNAAVLVRIDVQKASQSHLLASADAGGSRNDKFGFLYASDFNRSSIIQPLKDRPLISLDLGSFAGQGVEILFCFARGGNVPEGFFIDSPAKYTILSASVVPASVGFDFSASPARYAFAPNGGVLVKDSKTVDFSGLSLCLPAHNTESSLMPAINLRFVSGSGSEENKSEEPARFSIGGERISVRGGNGNEICIPSASLKSPYSVFEIAEGADRICSVMASPSDEKLLDNSSAYARSPVRPIKIDPGLIVQWPKGNWRGSDYEIFEWDRFDGVLFFDTASYSIQNDFFRRLAFFVEKKGYKGRLLTDSELEGKHGYNAHDYRAYDLARFFERARVQNFPLNRKELLLREILEANGIIERNEQGGWTEGRGAVISISQESPAYLRTTLLAHEGWHGIFFVDKEFRDICATVYYSLAAADYRALNFLVRYFQVTPSLNYDTSDDYLMKNEFMAYMLQRPVKDCEKYFTDIARRPHAQTYIKEEADYIISTGAAGLVGAAEMLDDYVNSKWNLAAGRVWLLSR